MPPHAAGSRVQNNPKGGDFLANENKPTEPVESIDTNEDIIEYIQTASMADLMKRFGIADENESIRNTDFNPLDGKKSPKKQPEDEERAASSFKKDPLYSSANTALASSFGSAESEFDNDAISFDEIDLDSLGDITVEDSPAEDEASPNTFDTHTRTVFIDDNLDDGIKRNDDIEVTDVFMNN